MNYEDLTEEQKEIWDQAWNLGFEQGFESGEEEAHGIGWNSGREEGYAEGAKAEQTRIQYVLNMMFESSINMGHGNKAVQYKHAMDLLRPIKIDYSEEAYQKGLEADGF
jgi:hypothetical protein